MLARPILIPLLIAIVAGRFVRRWRRTRARVDPKPLPPLDNPNDPKLGAKELFARKYLPSAQPAKVIGAYNKGCIAGAEQMPITGDTWQVMRLSRNRNWGHPDTDRAARSGCRRRRTRTPAGPASWSATSASRAAARRCPAMPAIRSASMPTSG